MAKQFRYERVSGPHDYWKVADSWASGYNFAKGLKWDHEDALIYKTFVDMHDGYKKGFEKCRQEGFFVVRKVRLSDEERAKIDEDVRQEKIKQAKREAALALKRIAELQKQ